MKSCLIIFAKEPKKGEVKTRLSNYLSQARCLEIYKAFLKDTIALAKGIKCDEKILAYDSNGSPTYLKKIAPNFKFYKQKGSNLGERMHNAFEYAEDKASKILIIGSDSPNLPPSYIKDAFRHLSHNDIVLGPSQDGGFYLIGLKKPCLAVFKGIEWSSERVLEVTVKNIRSLRKRLVILNKWYDVDAESDLVCLRQDLKEKKDKKIARWSKKILLDK